MSSFEVRETPGLGPKGPARSVGADGTLSVFRELLIGEMVLERGLLVGN